MKSFLRRAWRSATKPFRALWHLFVGLRVLVGLFAFSYVVYWIVTRLADQGIDWTVLAALAVLTLVVYVDSEVR